MSRPHNLIDFSDSLNDVDLLSDDDVEKSMRVLLNQKSAKIIIEKLQVKSPRVYQLIHNPVFLKLVAKLINEDDRDVWTYLTTSKLFYKFLEIIKLNAHHEYGLHVDDVKVLYRKLAEMTLEKTKQGSFVFKRKDLERYGLSGEDVQDFLFKFIFSKHNTGFPFGLDNVFSFLLGMSIKFKHKYLQEFFTAFAAVRLPVIEFKEFVGKLFPRLEKNEYGDVVGVGEDSFAILRVLIIRYVDEMKNFVLEGEEDMKKKLLEKLRRHLKQLFVKGNIEDSVREHQKQMLADLNDFKDEDICDEVKEQLKVFYFHFDYRGSELDVAAHREAFSHLLQHFTTQIGKLILSISDWKDGEIRRLFQSIQLSTAKIHFMHIFMNPQRQFHVIDHVIESLPHIKTKLVLELLGGDDHDDQQFCRQLEEEIKDLNTSKLQTEELEVEVYGQGNLYTPFLRFELQRG